jgi:hypothetical protein
MHLPEVVALLGRDGVPFDKIREENAPDVVAVREDGTWEADANGKERRTIAWRGSAATIAVRLGPDGDEVTDMTFIELKTRGFLQIFHEWLQQWQ